MPDPVKKVKKFAGKALSKVNATKSAAQKKLQREKGLSDAQKAPLKDMRKKGKIPDSSADQKLRNAYDKMREGK